MAKSFTSLADIKSAIEGMGFKIGDVWYDGNKSRPVFVCSREGLPHDIEVWAESPKYVNGVTIKDVSARDFDMVDAGEDVVGLKKAIKKALAYMGVKESNMQCSMLKKKESFARKSERVDFGARTISIPIGTFHSYDLAQDVANRITSACDYIEADARQQGHRTDEWVTVLTFEPKYFRDFKSYYTENYDSYCYMVTSTRDDFIRPDELEVRAYKSESRKNEASDSIRVYDEDLMVELTSVERYDDRFTDVPVVGDKFDLLEFRDLVEGLAETSNGYPDISRDGSELRVAIEVPQDEGDEYREELVLRGTVRVMHAALEQVVEYLEG